MLSTNNMQRTTKTFIGGLVIGAVAGAIVMNVGMCLLFIHLIK